MELLNEQEQVEKTIRKLPSNTDFLQISCNWQISNNKQFHEAFTIGTSSQSPEKTDIDDVVFLDTCISLKSAQSNNEPCMLDIKVTNHQRISRIAVVSEAYVLEFFKQFGEYETTIFAEFVDEFDGSSTYFAETTIIPSATEATIKFTKTQSRNSVMWIYGIRLYLTEPVNEPKDTQIFNPEIIQNLLSKLTFYNEENNIASNIGGCQKSIVNTVKSENLVSKSETVEKNNEKDIAKCNNANSVSIVADITTYIDNKFHDMETRLMNRIDEMEKRTNEKLDKIRNIVNTL